MQWDLHNLSTAHAPWVYKCHNLWLCKLWPSLDKPPICRILSHWDLYTIREHIYCRSEWYFYFFNRTFLCKVMSFWIRTIRKLISIARDSYNACKFWTRRTSGSVRELTIAWKYVYKNLMLHSGSPKHSIVMNAISGARDRSSCMTIELWTHVT